MPGKNEALIHLKYIREMVERVEDKVERVENKLDAHIEKSEETDAENRGLAQGAHAKVDALVNKGVGFRLGVGFGLAAGGGSLGAAIMKFWPWQ